MSAVTAGSLFSGIGGLDLGLERAGFEVRWQSEIEPYCCKVLAKHWPDVPNLGDVRTIEWSGVERVDLICGGFPCQDISNGHTNGVRRSLGGAKSGLWHEFKRAIGRLEPRWVVVENVAAWQRWVADVRSALGLLGYGSVAVQLSAGQFGLPHRRPRVFVVADADGQSEPLRAVDATVAGLCPLPIGDEWPARARAVGADDGVPHRVDRLRALGNAVVPQVAEFIGAQLLAAS